MIRKVIDAIINVLKRWAKTLRVLLPGKERSDAPKKKAVAYTSDIIVARTREVINRAGQKSLITRFAEENGIEVVAWFEDEVYDEDVFTRPGIQKMLSYKKPYDIFLVERVWALSRKMFILTGFFNVLGQKKVRLHIATLLWDCTSQMVRRLLAGKGVVPAKVVEPAMAGKAFRIVEVRRLEKRHSLIAPTIRIPAV
jgi:hypothetical protein